MDRQRDASPLRSSPRSGSARHIDAILETFVADPFLETMPLGLRSEGRGAVRAAYQAQ
jgi:hypothetical protein